MRPEAFPEVAGKRAYLASGGVIALLLVVLGSAFVAFIYRWLVYYGVIG